MNYVIYYCDIKEKENPQLLTSLIEQYLSHGKLAATFVENEKLGTKQLHKAILLTSQTTKGCLLIMTAEPLKYTQKIGPLLQKSSIDFRFLMFPDIGKDNILNWQGNNKTVKVPKRKGNPNISRATRQKGIAKVMENALNDPKNVEAYLIIKKLRQPPNPLSYAKIANALNEKGITTRYGKEFQKGSVKILYDRFLKFESFVDMEPTASINLKKLSLSVSVSKIGANYNVTPENSYEMESPIKPKTILEFGETEQQINSYFNNLASIVRQAHQSLSVINYLEIPNVNNSKFNPAYDIDISIKYRDIYFKTIEDICNRSKRDFLYQRVLQIPQIYNYKGATAFQKMVIALYFLAPTILHHISTVYTSNKSIKLFISSVPTEAATYMKIDDNTVIQESTFFSDFNGKKNPKELSVFESTVFLKYIDKKIANVIEFANEVDIENFLLLGDLISEAHYNGPEQALILYHSSEKNYNRYFDYKDWSDGLDVFKDLRMKYPISPNDTSLLLNQPLA